MINLGGLYELVPYTLPSKSFMLWFLGGCYALYPTERECHITQQRAARRGSEGARRLLLACTGARTNQDLDQLQEQTDGFTTSTASNTAGSAEFASKLRSWVTRRETN